VAFTIVTLVIEGMLQEGEKTANTKRQQSLKTKTMHTKHFWDKARAVAVWSALDNDQPCMNEPREA
jgi:uncharacterized protein YheU (UPF0270 family)